MAQTSRFSFIDYLSIQRVAPSTKESYLRAVTDLSAFHNDHDPAELNNDQIQDFLLYSIQDKKLAWSSCNVLFCGLKKYYHNFLGREINDFYIPPRTRSKKIPMLLSREEVFRLLQAPANLKHRAADNGLQCRSPCQ